MIRRALAPCALILACALASAFAQNINRSLQLSGDPSGIFNVDTNNNVYFSRHVLNRDTNPPVLSGCGTAPSILGNDTVGKLTTGSAATTCTVTFSLAYAVAPACVISAQGTATQPTFTTSTTAITITVDIASTVYNYICMSTG